MVVTIKRQLSPQSEPYWESFHYEGSADNTVAAVLDNLNYGDDIYNIDGKESRRINWECSCLQGLCGGCAMVINGTPALACETFISELMNKKQKAGKQEFRLTLEPLRKFFVISDLVVDRGVIIDRIKEAEIYLEKYEQASPKEYEHQYQVAKCLKCGLCLEVCPNYVKGDTFLGAPAANDCYLVASQSGGDTERIKKTYEEVFASGCSKSMSCMDVCPMNIPTLSSMAKMNSGAINRDLKHKKTK
ncbi:MAG: succinate dehydrogenase/fumarate reductase iron-sulfur subunit [Eubacterium sp.]|nr:succinate dehydrogenase/fumarate reductase iron-sulfur subunit [Eubacterium sp.]